MTTVLLQAAKRTWMKSWSAVVKVMTLLSPFNLREFSVSGEMGHSLFPKMSTSPLFFSVPTPYPVKSSVLSSHPVLSQFRLSVRSTIKFKIKGCEQSYFYGIKLLGLPLFSLGRDFSCTGSKPLFWQLLPEQLLQFDLSMASPVSGQDEQNSVLWLAIQVSKMALF